MKIEPDFKHAFCRLTHQVFNDEATKVNKTIGGSAYRHDMVTRDKGYKCIHLDVPRFVETLKEILENNFQELRSGLSELKFLDVGCGVGQKVFLANRLFNLESYGLELRQPLVKAARKLLGKTMSWWSPNKEKELTRTIIQGNALTFHYAKFDIIYFYCPIADHDLELKLEKQIAHTAKRGAIVMGFLCHYFLSNNKELKKLGWSEHKIGHYCSYFKRDLT